MPLEGYAFFRNAEMRPVTKKSTKLASVQSDTGALPLNMSIEDGPKPPMEVAIDCDRSMQQKITQDEVIVDFRRLTMTARGRGLDHVRPLLIILFLGLVASFLVLFAMVQVAAHQSPAVTSVIEKAISRL